jgi:hypothetical protein
LQWIPVSFEPSLRAERGSREKRYRRDKHDQQSQ